MKQLNEVIEKPQIDELDELKELKETISKMTFVEQQSYFYNMAEGDLNKADGIDCPICKNKGRISIVENNHEFIKDCECMKKRIMYHRFMDSGISKDQFKKYTLEQYKVENESQRLCLEMAQKYIYDIRNDKKAYWMYLGGESGTGKTHLCTGIITKLLNGGYTVKYMVWNTEISSLISQRKNFYDEEQRQYKQRIKELKNSQVLYIDDFLQLDTDVKEALSIAYEIINSRYTDDSKITIISSEVNTAELYKLSKALCGRIMEKSNNGEYAISYNDPSANYRLRKGEQK